MKDTIAHNEAFWDKEALSQHSWSIPVSKEVIAHAKQGQWQIHITKTPLPTSWLPRDVNNKNILCLASAGGQQGPVLAAAGANVTVFDISEKQLELDRHVAKRDGLELKTVKGDMSDLSAFRGESFDYIIHPISNLYVPDIKSVWKECYRVLNFNGVLLSSFYNPVLFVFDRDTELEKRGLLKPINRLPYPTSLADARPNEAIIFGHTLTDQLGGQIEAGFHVIGFFEDEHPSPRFLIERYMKTMIATKSIKGSI
ncbi:class I SAM-dependent methyltransferase [Candidatus Dojkabacteria bacterium]|uniref:Class I SAM-dependent methyltransferase n=1 Tax=Candidatus Dojkabacteria bacterium TaxID=2099670 RepID=A0A5C7J6C4_9BACT|nr:MAG: class I SAM-dependent methyltransferase [Candidatus Dojkabacteria bacterium]